MNTDNNFNLQPILHNNKVVLRPLLEDDFEKLYLVASDPLIWAQHPNPDRWQKSVFSNFFKGALESGGAFVAIYPTSGEYLGSTRFYDFKPEERSVLIGYTFISRSCWGTGINHVMKSLMLDYAFHYVDRVIFHIGANNIRSQKSIEKLGAKHVNTLEVAYFGEVPRTNFEYEIQKEDWVRRIIESTP
ncbi:MAG: GNAT family N-acetyltransferase [Saprospiraceae bacterium]|nr:GNAT family N-acetyltransferase [Saprospiraceae bacterium]